MNRVELMQLLRTLELTGYVVIKTDHNTWEVQLINGRIVAILTAHDEREGAWLNILATLRRAGVLPPERR